MRAAAGLRPAQGKQEGETGGLTGSRAQGAEGRARARHRPPAPASNLPPTHCPYKPPQTSPICFDKGGLDPYHPYVVARAESGIPEYNLQQVKFGWIVKDNNNNGTQYTFAFQGPNTTPPGCAFI